MFKFFRQTLFTLGFIVAAVKDIPRRIRLKYYLWKYGKGNIPDEKVSKVFGEVTAADLRHMKTCTEIFNLADVLGRDVADLQLGRDVINTMQGKLIDMDRLIAFNKLTKIETDVERRQSIIGHLQADGDLTETLYNFKRPEIDRFVNPTQTND